MLDDPDGELVWGERGSERIDRRLRPVDRSRGDDVRRDGEQRGRSRELGLLEKAPARALPRDAERIARRCVDAVGGEGQLDHGSGPGEHLVAPVAAGCEDEARREPLDEIDHRPCDGRRSVRDERLVLGDVYL